MNAETKTRDVILSNKTFIIDGVEQNVVEIEKQTYLETGTGMLYGYSFMLAFFSGLLSVILAMVGKNI